MYIRSSTPNPPLLKVTVLVGLVSHFVHKRPSLIASQVKPAPPSRSTAPASVHSVPSAPAPSSASQTPSAPSRSSAPIVQTSSSPHHRSAGCNAANSLPARGSPAPFRHSTDACHYSDVSTPLPCRNTAALSCPSGPAYGPGRRRRGLSRRRWQSRRCGLWCRR
jgi:hypothetical protein